MGYRIEIDHANCLNCAVCMDVCPVEALDMSRPAGPGIEAAGRGTPQPWMMERPHPGRRVHRLRHLHPRVPDSGHDPGHGRRANAAGRAAGTDQPPAGRRGGLDPALGGHP